MIVCMCTYTAVHFRKKHISKNAPTLVLQLPRGASTDSGDFWMNFLIYKQEEISPLS